MAKEWQFTPSVAVYGSYTSNARLAPPGQEEADFFTTVTPGIDVHGNTQRLKLDLNYALDAIGYARDQGLSELRNRLQFASTATVVPGLLFLDGFAAILQEPSNDERPGSSSPLAGSTDLETVHTYSLSPHLNNHFGSFGDTELRYTFNQVFSNELPDTTSNRVGATFVSGSRFSRLLWTLDANGENSTGSRDTSSRFGAASVEYRLTRIISPLVSVGYEKIDDSTLVDEPNGPIASAGVRLTPGPRTSVTLLYNHRYDSDFFTGDASYLIGPRTRIAASYTERLETSQTQFADNLSFLTRDEFGNFVDSRTERLFTLGDTNFGLEDNAFRLRALNVTMHAVRGRNTYDALAYYERRDIEITGERDTAAGGEVTWARQLTPITSLNLMARYRYEIFDEVTETDHQNLVGAGATLVRNLNPTLDGVIAVNFARNFSDQEDDEFLEAVVSIGLVKRF
jgi:uncharacterized protein (PEP-CTERM system associated)